MEESTGTPVPAVSLHIASLLQSFAAVPPAAAPAIVDCVTSCSGISPAGLLQSLMQASLDSNSPEAPQSNYLLSYTTALCHLITKSDTIQDSLLPFIKKMFALLGTINPNDSLLLNQVLEKACALISRTCSWKLSGSMIVPFCLKSLGFSDEESLNSKGSDNQEFKDVSGLLPLVACRTLTVLMEYALTSWMEYHNLECKSLDVVGPRQSFDHGHVDEFFYNILRDLSNVVLEMLMRGQEDRSRAIRDLLPHILLAFSELHFSRVSSPCIPSRTNFSKELWKCCVSLFSIDHIERLDAYTILSWYFFSFCNTDRHAKNVEGNSDEDFHISNQEEFWEEIRRGLVDREATVRKHALYILKLSVNHYFFYLGEGYINFSSSTSKEYKDANESQNFGSTSGTESLSYGGGITKRERWADKEAKSMGVGEVCSISDQLLSSEDRWKVFIFLYEMLEEYGTHLVEAAWVHQVSLFFQVGSLKLNTICLDACQVEVEITNGIFKWLAVLWERGLFHNNPQVRCLIMQSFLGIAWDKYDGSAKMVPKSFVLGPFILGLNDVVHHKEFGLKGVYTSKAIQDSINFFHSLSCQSSFCERIELVCCLGSAARKHSFGRSGLMALAFCISSVASGPVFCKEDGTQHVVRSSLLLNSIECCEENLESDWAINMLDVLGYVIEISNHHFNQRYRSQVCEQVLKAAFLVNVYDVPLDVFFRFLSNVPCEFTDISGPLRQLVEGWLCPVNHQCGSIDLADSKARFLESLVHFPTCFMELNCLRQHGRVVFDDEDVDLWRTEVQRWARVLFLVNTAEKDFEPIFLFIQKHCSSLCSSNEDLNWIPMKLLVLILGLIEEFEMRSRRISSYTETGASLSFHKRKMPEIKKTQWDSDLCKKLANIIHYVLVDLLCFAKSVCQIFWSSTVADDHLPSSIRGKLGGPSQRRLGSLSTTSALEAIFSIRTISSIFSWCSHSWSQGYLESTIAFLWDFCWKVIHSTAKDSETCAELHLAAYESLVYIFKALSTVTPSAIDFIVDHNKSQEVNVEDKGILDLLIRNFMQSINSLLDGILTRSRRAVLMNCKWLCLDSLLSIPYNVTHHSTTYTFISDSMLRYVFDDIVESLENAVDDSVLPMLRSVRLILGLLCSHKMSSMCSLSCGVNSEMMMKLVRSSWALHLSCHKRRVAPIAALLSSVLHQAVFGDISMHETNDGQQGPLKWFIEKFLDEGVKSPRTIRLAALHLSGLWLLYPITIKYYIKELKLLTLYGSVAFDEDFESELSENLEAKMEVSFLAQSPDFELKEVFINTEMFARVSIAVLFYNLFDLINKNHEDTSKDSQAALLCGKMFLLELLDFAVHDKDLAKELYKKCSAIHRRKVRVWQMMCILSRFVDENVVEEVTSKLHICLTRNNLPAVRQYLEIFAIQIYLKFPLLAEKQLNPIFYDYSMRPQAVSSYVFIASNIILHACELSIQIKHLNDLLPPIIPFLTSHHHSLRGFTQLLIYHVLHKLWQLIEPTGRTASVERKCFQDLKSYLAENSDCARLRASMDGFLVAFHPKMSASPAGVFNVRNEGAEFECAPMSLMEQVINFLNEARNDLRESIAKDSMAIKSENFSNMQNLVDGECLSSVDVEGVVPRTKDDISLNFQKKINLDENALQQTNTKASMMWNADVPKLFLEMEMEDQLLSPVVRSRNQTVEKIKASQQQFILVASLLDRIPNIAGLARTCEIFKASCLAIADTSILLDKQFQLISVTAEKWVPVIEVPVNNMKDFFEKKKREGFSIIGLEQTANSVPLDEYRFPRKTVLVLGREKEGIPVDIIHVLDACVEIPQLGIIRSLNVHVSGAIALWEYTRQQRSSSSSSTKP